MPVDPHPLIVTCTECDAQYDAEDSPCPCCGSSSQTVDRYELADWQEANGDDPFPNEPIPGPDPGACPDCGAWRKAGVIHRCTPDPFPSELRNEET